MRLKDKVAIITGAGKGMGRDASALFASEGARVVAFDLDEAAAQETLQIIEKAGGKGIAVSGDVSSEADVKRAIQAGVDTFGKLDIL